MLILNNSWSTAASSVFISTEQQKTAQDAEAMGKSRGGLTTKIHAAVDALGNPVRLLLTPGQASEYGQEEARLDGFKPDQVLADKGYDLDAFVESIQRVGAEAVIPSRKHRQQPRPLDRHIYKDRNVVERFSRN